MISTLREWLGNVSTVVYRYRVVIDAVDKTAKAINALGDFLQVINRSFPIVTKTSATFKQVANFTDLANPILTGWTIYSDQADGDSRIKTIALFAIQSMLFANVTSQMGLSPFG